MNHDELALLSIVIPAYNEAQGLAAILERTLRVESALRRAVPDIHGIELIVVDDGSTDQTAAIAQRYPKIRLIQHPVNQGYGSALKTGFAAAQGRYVGFLDADGTYPPEHFPQLCQTLEQQGADIVIGSRMSGAASRMPWERSIGNRLFAQLLSWIVGRQVTDTTSGMRVFRRSVLPQLLPLPNGLHLTPAMSARAYHESLKILEVPIPYDERVGRSKLNPLTDGFRFLNIIVGIARLYNPLRLFSAVGLAILALAAWLGIGPVMYYLTVRRVEDTEIYRLFTIMVLAVTGINLITFGAFANYAVEIFHGHRLHQHGWLGRWLLTRGFLRWSGWIGGLLILAAPVLNRQVILEYITTGRIYTHWVYVLTGATLFLIGLQLVMGSILIAILQEVKRSGTHLGTPPTG